MNNVEIPGNTQKHKIVKQRKHKLQAVYNKGETTKGSIEKALWTKPQFVMEESEMGSTKCKRYNWFMIYQNKKLLHLIPKSHIKAY